jgi:hypothetical protein
MLMYLLFVRPCVRFVERIIFVYSNVTADRIVSLQIYEFQHITDL